MISVLLSLVILAVLYFGYFRFQSMESGREVGETAIDAGRAVACRTQRQAFQSEIEAWTLNHDGDVPTLEDLEAEGVPIPQCPEGGEYRVVGRQLRCSLHP